MEGASQMGPPQLSVGVAREFVVYRTDIRGFCVKFMPSKRDLIECVPLN